MAGRVSAGLKDWERVASLDSLLIQSRPTDQWFVESTKLMVEWRSNIANQTGRSDLAEQAWQIIDLAIAIHPHPDLFSSRVVAAYLADRPEEVLETARRMTYVIEGELDRIREDESSVNAATISFREGQIRVIEEALTDTAVRHSLSAVSVREVRDRLDQRREQIEEIKWL